jgi:hypothetical protein
MIPPVPVGTWPVVDRPEAEPAPALALVPPVAPGGPPALNDVLPPLELVSPGGGRRWLRDLVLDRPLVLVLSTTGRDPIRDELVGTLADEGVTSAVVTADGAGHTYASVLAFEALDAPHGGVFVVDCACRLRLAYTALAPGEWLPASTVRSRVRRLAA